MTSNNKDLSEIYVRFVDILFAVVLATSFSTILSPQGLPNWLMNPLANITILGNVLLAYTLVITSWIGYHMSVSKLPIKSVWRFLIDILLLFLYNAAFMNITSFQIISIILAIVFMCYLIWVTIRYFEYKQEASLWNIKERVVHAVIFAVSFIVIAFFANFIVNQTVDGILLVCSFILLILYRYIYRGGPKKRG